MTNKIYSYSIDDGFGDTISAGLPAYLDRDCAQETGTVIGRDGRDTEPEDARSVARTECERVIRGARSVRS